MSLCVVVAKISNDATHCRAHTRTCRNQNTGNVQLSSEHCSMSGSAPAKRVKSKLARVISFFHRDSANAANHNRIYHANNSLSALFDREFKGARYVVMNRAACRLNIGLHLSAENEVRV